MKPPHHKTNRKALIGSILISIFFHALQIHFFQHQSLWFSSFLQKTEEVPWTYAMEKRERDEILKRAFEPAYFSQKAQSSAAKIAEVKQGPILMQWPDISPAKTQEPTPLITSFFPKQELISSSMLPRIIPKWKEKDPFLESLPSALASLPPSTPSTPDAQPSTLASSLEMPQILIEAPQTMQTSPPSPLNPNEQPSFILEKNLLSHTVSRISSLPANDFSSLKTLQSVSYSNEFEADLLFLEEEDGHYIFAITLVPQTDLQLPQLKNTYYFLIDRANSIQRERLQATKNAIRKAIDELGEQDKFNIIAFDSKVDKLFSLPMPSSPDSRAKAQNFLNKIELGSFFSKSDLYKPLFLTLPANCKEDEVHVAILMSDGESLQNNDAMELFKSWSEQNQGRVALYSVNLNEDAAATKLAILSTLNKGKTIFSSTKRGLKRKLLKLMKSIHAPVAKNLSCLAISTSSQATIEILPGKEHTPHLFQSEPFTIVGRTDSLDDFILFIQGRLCGEWMHIKKPLSFLNAKKGHASLKTEWAIQKAYALYENYLEKNDIQALEEAKELAQNNSLQITFQ